MSHFDINDNIVAFASASDLALDSPSAVATCSPAPTMDTNSFAEVPVGSHVDRSPVRIVYQRTRVQTPESTLVPTPPR